MKILVKKGWKLNPNKKVLNAIIKRINKCDGECPCDNPGETLEDRICPCKEYRENNICHCNLYVHENNDSK